MYSLDSGQYFNFVISNAILFYQASEKEVEKKNQTLKDTKINPKEEEFHLDGDSIKYHVQTISGKL